MSASSKPIPISIPNELLDKINYVAGRMTRSKQEIMRLAMEVGLEDLKRSGYDLASAVVDKAHQKRDAIIVSSVVSETPTEYKAAKPAKPEKEKPRRNYYKPIIPPDALPKPHKHGQAS